MADTFLLSPAITDWLQRTIPAGVLPEKEQMLLYPMDTKEVRLTFNQIKSMSAHSRIPFGYFFLTDPPDEEIGLVEHRTVNSTKFKNPSRNFMDTYYRMEAIQDWMIDYLEDQEADDLPFIGKYKLSSSSELAEAIRDVIGIESDDYLESSLNKTFNELKKKISDAGIIVMQSGIVGNNTSRSLDLNEFRGFAIFNKKAPLIFINSRDSTSGKTFTLLHELAHLLLGSDDLFNSSDEEIHLISPAETMANKAAAEVILPTEVFKQAWLQTNLRDHKRAIALLAGKFKCSKTVIARKALDQGYINNNEYRAISAEVTQAFNQSRENRRKGGGNYLKTLGSRWDANFLITLNDSVRSGRTNYIDAYRLTETKAKTFNKLTENAERDLA